MVGLWYGMTIRTLIRSYKPGRNSISSYVTIHVNTLISERTKRSTSQLSRFMD